MAEKTMEHIIMELVVNSGNARSLCIEAIRLAREGQFEEAEKRLAESDQALNSTHQIQTDLIQKEAAGDHIQVQLLMVHAQDHLMNAMTVRDMAQEIIQLTKLVVK